MRTVRLVALSDDGKTLVLVADDPDGGEGERFTLPVDERLRAAARGDARRLGQIDVDAGTALPPRVIQARIRAGRTPEQVAAESGTPVERILRFAHPVLQERARIAEQAREARVRLSEGTLTVNLHQFMAERVRMIGTDSEGIGWDAHRGDDGSWLVTAAYQADTTAGVATWVYDPAGRTVAPSDAATMDFAEGTRLVRVVPDVPHQAPAGPPPATQPATPAATQTATPPGTPVAPLRRAPAPADLQPTAEVPDEADDVRPPTGAADEALLDELAEHDTVVLARPGEDGEGEDPRVHIPAWEDIVFGVRRHR